MKRVSVHIATTEGPAAIQRITAEDPEVRSVVCLGGKAISLPISADYDAFVRNPTGVIETCFGHGAFRVDVEGEISSGLSWQLGIFLGHALAAANRLASPQDRVDMALWASGEIDRDLKIGAVQDIALKLARSKDLFTRLRGDGIAIVIAVPAANAAEARTAVEEILGPDGADVRIVAVDTISEVLSALRLAAPKRARRWLKKPVRRRTQTALGGAVAAAIAAIALAGWTGGEEPEMFATASRAPAGSSCAEVHFGIRPPVIETWRVPASGKLPALRITGLCDLTYRIASGAGGKRWVWVIAARENEAGGGFRIRSLQDAGDARPLAAQTSLELDAMPPRRLDAKLRQDFAVLVSRPGVDPTEPKLQQAVTRVMGAGDRAEWDRFLQLAAGAGARVHRFRQVFRP